MFEKKYDKKITTVNQNFRITRKETKKIELINFTKEITFLLKN